MMHVPELPLEPPEDRRPVYATCQVCEEPIRAGDDAWNIPNFGYCCERCIDDAHEIEVEVDD